MITNDTLLGQYHLLERIGRGGMAEVYRARALSSDREVAIKLIRTELTDDPTLSRRFLREVRTLCRLAHPHIVSPITWGAAEGICYLVLPWVREGTLSQYLSAQGGALPLEHALPLFGQLCQAVQYAHEAGIIHRDLKPQNVLVQPGPHLLLADFGVALDCTDTRLTSTGAGPGSATYMAPEQAIGQATPRSDVYSLGIVLYQLLTGVVPFSGATPFEVLLKHQLAPVPDPRQFQPDLPAAVVQALASALAKEPEARCASAQALWEALQQPGSLAPVLAAPLAPALRAHTAHPLIADEGQSWSDWPGGHTTLPLSQTASFQRPPSRRRKELMRGGIAGIMLLVFALFVSAYLSLGISPGALSLRVAPSTKATRLSGPTSTPVPPPHSAAPVKPTPTTPSGGGQNGDQDGQDGSSGHGKGHGDGGSDGEGGHGKGGGHGHGRGAIFSSFLAQ